jgi:predicted ribosome quality control (RQC) complex YloA/Tae2 family protein
MAFDGVVTAAVAWELDRVCALGKIEKIYQPDKDELVFHIHTPKANLKLYLSCNPNHPGVYLIPGSPVNPQDPGSFCMLLRKHLLGSRISSIKQVDSERIIEILLETRDEMNFRANKKLIIEIMGKHSNIILLDVDKDRMIDTIKRVPLDVSRDRQLLPGLPYEYPQNQNKVSFRGISQKLMDEISSSQDPAEGLLARIQGFSPQIAQEVAKLESSISRTQWIASLLQRLELGRLEPQVFMDSENSPIDFHVVPLHRYEGFDTIKFETVSQAIDYYYTNKASTDRLRQKATGLQKTVSTAIKKNLLKQKRIREDLLQAEEAERFRLFGELLTANLHEISPGTTSVLVLNYYDGKQVEIPVDKRLTPAQNAQAYYKKYNKSKRAVLEKTRMLMETQAEHDYLGSVLVFLDITRDPAVMDTIREELTETGYLRGKKEPQGKSGKKKGKAMPFRYLTDDGFVVFAGRNNNENDDITFKQSQRNDLWFHTKDIHGAHVVLKVEGKEPTENAIRQAAAIAAFHSKGNASDNVPVDYTRVRYVKKPQGAKPGKCIYTEQKTLYVTPSIPQSTESSEGPLKPMQFLT